MRKVFSPLGKAVDFYQVEACMSTYRISVLTGLNQGTLSNLKYGKASPSVDTIERIAAALGTKASLIIAKKEEIEEAL